MGKFSGKTLLELGTNNGSVDIVKYAKSEGAYVIVTDYLPPEKSEAKQYADETAMISTQDIGALVEFAKQKKVDGIFCGVHEGNLLAVQEVCNRLHLPCYFNLSQWDLFQNKSRFKELCRNFDVPVAKEFKLTTDFRKEDLDVIEYPVIVKPVDLCASRGIHICNNEKELRLGYTDAFEKSLSHCVIVEKYIVGDEISATYSFVNGECRLSMVSEMCYNLEQKGKTPLPDAYIYPSKHLQKYEEIVNKRVIEMLKSTGLKNGSVFITGIANGSQFAFFEAGLRIAGTLPYIFVDHINGINIMELMVEYALTGCINGSELINKENPNLQNKTCCLFSLLNKGGTISKIEGLEIAEKCDNVIRVIEQRKIGDNIIADGTLGQVHLRFYIVSDSIEEIKKTIKKIKNVVLVYDEFGNNMLMRTVADSIL